jgi:glutathione synthase/RimK-type ligase-like ATP-grasp enzyme
LAEPVNRYEFVFLAADKIVSPETPADQWLPTDQPTHAIEIQRAREQFKLKIKILRYDSSAGRGVITVDRATVEDRTRIQQFIESLCTSKNRMLIVGEKSRTGAGYNINREEAEAGAYSMWFQCIY